MCDCIERANAELATHNTRLSCRESINMKTGKIRRVLVIPTEKISKRGKPAKYLLPNYCPLCGEKRSTERE